jgi:hypothetical protein
MSEFKKYYNTITKDIVVYPEDAAALFDVLKPVPSEKETTDEDDAPEETVVIELKDNKNAK